MIGNDIVDLLDPDARPESFRPRFDERVFSAEERRAIARDTHPLARRWAHWAAKEAAYKLAKQLDRSTVFSPARYVPVFANHGTDSNQTSVRRERHGQMELPQTLRNEITTLELRSFETPERVHVVAVPLGSDWGGVDLAVEAIDREGDDPSFAVRAMAIREVGRSLGVTEDRLAIGRDGRIPTLELDGSRTSLSLSLSHHGRWISYAMRLHVELQSLSELRDGWDDAAGRATRRMWSK